MCSTCDATVLGAIPSSAAISAFVEPSATSRATSNSRARQRRPGLGVRAPRPASRRIVVGRGDDRGRRAERAAASRALGGDPRRLGRAGSTAGGAGQVDRAQVALPDRADARPSRRPRRRARVRAWPVAPSAVSEQAPARGRARAACPGSPARAIGGATASSQRRARARVARARVGPRAGDDEREQVGRVVDRGRRGQRLARQGRRPSPGRRAAGATSARPHSAGDSRCSSRIRSPSSRASRVRPRRRVELAAPERHVAEDVERGDAGRDARRGRRPGRGARDLVGLVPAPVAHSDVGEVGGHVVAVVPELDAARRTRCPRGASVSAAVVLDQHRRARSRASGRRGPPRPRGRPLGARRSRPRAAPSPRPSGRRRRSTRRASSAALRSVARVADGRGQAPGLDRVRRWPRRAGGRACTRPTAPARSRAADPVDGRIDGGPVQRRAAPSSSSSAVAQRSAARLEVVAEQVADGDERRDDGRRGQRLAGLPGRRSRAPRTPRCGLDVVVGRGGARAAAPRGVGARSPASRSAGAVRSAHVVQLARLAVGRERASPPRRRDGRLERIGAPTGPLEVERPGTHRSPTSARPAAASAVRACRRRAPAPGCGRRSRRRSARGGSRSGRGRWAGAG